MPSNSKSKSSRGKGRGGSTSTPSSPREATKKRTKSLPTGSNVANTKDHRRTLSVPSTISHPPQQSARQTPVLVKPKLLKRFYEALVILAILGQNRGDKTEEEECETESDPLGLNPNKLRRAFIRNLAYLCDYKKGGDSTTAIALEQKAQCVVYHVASNKHATVKSGGEDRTTIFLGEILLILKRSSLTAAEDIEAEIFEMSVIFSSARILEYARMLKPKISFILQYLENLQQEEDTSFKQWLRNLIDAARDPKQLCQLCFDVRRSEEYTSLQHRAQPGSPCAEHYERIRHLIGRLNHTLKAIKTIISASLRFPQLVNEFEIVREKSLGKLPPPLKERKPSLWDIAGRMLKDPSEIEKFRRGLEDLDLKFGLSGRLREKCESSTWQPKVHAELILLDIFWTQSFQFVNGDRYIGCSKPACYCCHQYIRAHPGNFVVPACHNNNYLNWRPPDVLDANNDFLIKTRENILNKMAKWIRADAIAQIMACRGPNEFRPDSMTEISSVRLADLRLSSSDEVEMSGEDLFVESSYSDGLMSDSAAESGGGYSLEEESDEEDEGDDGGVLLDQHETNNEL